MEQTSAPARESLEPAALRLDGFRRSLRDREQRAFDRVLDRARARAAVALDPGAAGPAEVLFLSVLIEQELSIMRMEAAVEDLCWSVLGRAGHPPAPARG
jgi:hypothetical protein